MRRKHVASLAAAGLVAASTIAFAARRHRKKGQPAISPVRAHTMQTGYFHLASIAVKVGDSVRRGHVIGTMGADPNGGPRHLHFEVAPFPWPNGEYRRADTLNPRELLSSGVLGWPVQDYQGRRAQISSGHRVENPSRPKHAGADFMLPRRPTDTQPVRKGEGAPRYVAPIHHPILAAADGIVTHAGVIGTGGRVWIRHA
jgi:murein DD-endopeptidase MepM/ murein hydrolase activator NlpD